MQINTAKTVRDLAVEIPGATRVFEKVGIDYCCGGGKSFKEACAAAGVSTSEVARSLKEIERSNPVTADSDWLTQPLSELTSFIVSKHHLFTREEIRRLSQLLIKVCSVHAQNHPELIRIQSLFEDICNELIPHMQKEEAVLFPYIEEMERAVSSGSMKPVPFFGTVANPVRMMMMEHETAGEVLREIRKLSGGFVVPEGVCISYETLYKALEAFEQDLHQHIHLENNILFPRAVEMEGE
jgi:regulator of cell morphogenesis and NO signaling